MKSRSVYAVPCLALVTAVMCVCCAATAETAVDAKRQMADRFLMQRNYPEAIVLLREIITADARYRDYVKLARALEANQQQIEAAAAYRKVIEIVGAGKDADERTARAEAERKIKLLDTLSVKLNTALDKFLKDLDAVEREADDLHNAAVAERAFKMRVAALKLSESADRCAFLVFSTPPNWQDTGFKVVQGQAYRVRARGTWRMGPDARSECTANGLTKQPPNEYGPIGMLQGAVDQKPPFIKMGEDCEFVAPATGVLGLGRNQGAGIQNSGQLRVVIERR